jgi:DNA-binding beta-propeller fold protein YncE
VGELEGAKMRTMTKAFAQRSAAAALLAALCVAATPAGASAAANGVTKIKLAHVSSSVSDTNPPGDTVAVDPASDTIAATGTVGSTNETALSGGRVWIVDGRKHKLAHTIDLDGASLGSVTDDAATGTFYVADPELIVAPDTTAGGVAVISARTGKLTDEIPAPGIAGGIGADPKTDAMYAAGPGYAITPVNGHANAVLAPIDPGDILYPGFVSIDSATDVAYVGGGASGGTDGVWIVGLKTGQLFGVTTAKPVSIQTLGPPSGVATDPGTHRTYVALDNSTGSEVATIDGTGARFAKTKQLKNGNSTDGIAVDTATHAVYVSNVNETAGCPGFVDEISGRSGKVVGAVYNLATPDALAVDPKTDTVYVQDGGALDAFHGGFANKQKKCGTPGTVIGAIR